MTAETWAFGAVMFVLGAAGAGWVWCGIVMRWSRGYHETFLAHCKAVDGTSSLYREILDRLIAKSQQNEALAVQAVPPVPVEDVVRDMLADIDQEELRP